MRIWAKDFQLSEAAFHALCRLRDKPHEPQGYENFLRRLIRKGLALKADGPYPQLTVQGQLFLGVGLDGREQLAGATTSALELLVKIVAHRGTLPAAQVDHRVMRGIGGDSQRRWARHRLGEEGMVVEATEQGLAFAQLLVTPLVQSEDPEDAKRFSIVRSCKPSSALFPALARGAVLDPEDLPQLYHLRDLGLAELVSPSMAPPPRSNSIRILGAPVWRFTLAGGHQAHRFGFEVFDPLPTSSDPVQPLPLGSGHTLRALVQGHELIAHDEHRLLNLEALRLAERLVPDSPEEPCLWRPTTAGVVLATVELHARANSDAVERGIPEPAQEAATLSATFGPSNATSESTTA